MGDDFYIMKRTSLKDRLKAGRLALQKFLYGVLANQENGGSSPSLSTKFFTLFPRLVVGYLALKIFLYGVFSNQETGVRISGKQPNFMNIINS